MDNQVNLKMVLDAAIGTVNPRKLEQLEQKLEIALGCSLYTQEVTDPIVIRFLLAKQLRDSGTSPGVVHSFEQLFMGVIRRAALKGLLPAPPEGPWTREWQSVLDVASEVQKAKAPLRSLAGWATARNIKPLELENDHLEMWVNESMISTMSLQIVKHVLTRWLPMQTNTALISDLQLSNRLQRKAQHGTVKTVKRA
ncbi:MAG: hypothetical protein NVS4B11_21270 [Ktedonobacteraceae bacterium]